MYDGGYVKSDYFRQIENVELAKFFRYMQLCDISNTSKWPGNISEGPYKHIFIAFMLILGAAEPTKHIYFAFLFRL